MEQADGSPASPDLDHAGRSRSLRSLAVLTSIYGALILIWLRMDAALWIVAVLAAATLPALWDVIADRRAALRLDETGLHWASGRMSGSARLEALDHVRFDTRLDLSVRVTLVDRRGKRIKLPQDCLPPHALLESALRARGVRTERHHFSLL